MYSVAMIACNTANTVLTQSFGNGSSDKTLENGKCVCSVKYAAAALEVWAMRQRSDEHQVCRLTCFRGLLRH